MRRAMEWLDRHLWAYALLIWLIGTGVVTLVSPDRSLLSAALRAAGLTAVTVGVLVYRRRRDSRAVGASGNQVVSLDRQLLKGEVPQDEAGRDGMRRLVARRRHVTRHWKWVLPLWSLMMGGIAVLLLVMRPGTREVLVAVGLFVFIGWFVWMSLRLRSRLDAMEKALGAAPAADDGMRAGRA